MITDEEKYRAETSRLVGMAMLMPFGALLLTPLAFFNQLGGFGFAIYFLVSSVGLIIGVTIIEIGRGILDKRERGIRRWE